MKYKNQNITNVGKPCTAPISPMGTVIELSKLVFLSFWGMRAEYLGQSLDTYTPSPSNRSSSGALQPEGTDVSF
jgi:hypothetical protein